MVRDEDLLVVESLEELLTDSVRFRLFSRHFDWSGTLSFTHTELAVHGEISELEIRNLLLGAFQQLFRAYASMPFSERILKPLLAATMDRLLPEMHHRIMQAAGYYGGRRRNRRLLVPDRNPPIETMLRGEHARRHLDQLEAAFDAAWAAGGLVDITNAVVQEQNTEPFLDPRDFERQRQYQGWFTGTPRPVRRTATEERIRRQEREIEAALFYGQGARTGRWGWPDEVLQRARETLVHCLSPVQRAEFERSNQFTVAAQNGRLFVVKAAESFNVEDHDYVYCCVPAEHVCVYDKMLASKLWLEAEFERFMRVANKRHKCTGRYIPGQDDETRRQLAWDLGLPVNNPAAIATLDFGA